MMKTIIQPDLNNQRGAATLLVVLVLLVGITLVTLTTSKTVLLETQIAADNYRTAQAVAAANYAMDYGLIILITAGLIKLPPLESQVVMVLLILLRCLP